MKWNGDKYKDLMRIEMENRLEGAITVVFNRMRRLLSVSGTGVRLEGGEVVKKVKGGSRGRGKTVYGAFPSRPGESPHKQTGELRRSIAKEVDRKNLVARAGTNKLYGKWLEFGTSKMAPRPWARRALMESFARIRKILNGR